MSLETVCLILAYKMKYPENIFMLRGNHESASINRYIQSLASSAVVLPLVTVCCRIYGFYDECKRRYSIKLWKTFTDCFNCLPLGL